MRLGANGWRAERGLRRLLERLTPCSGRISSLGRKTFMASIIDRRVTAHVQGDFVVFLIGMRINKLWKPHKWLPSLRTMPRMLKELEAAPTEHGFLGSMNLGLLSLVQYLAQLRSPRGFCAGARQTALARMARIQSSHEGFARRRRHLARDLSHPSWRVRKHL